MGAKKKSLKPTKAAASASPAPSKSSEAKLSKSPAPPATSLLAAVLMAAVAFLGGVLTPPSMHAIRQNNVNVNTSSVTSADDTPALPNLPFPLPTRVPCTPSNLDNYLHATPVHGLHVVCVDLIHYDEEQKEITLPETSDIYEQQRRLDQTGSLRLTFYKGSHSGPLRRRVKVGNINNLGGVQSISWNEVKMRLITELGLTPEGPTKQPWAVFTALGERIVGENDDFTRRGKDELGSNNHIMTMIASSGIIVITQGGNWVWPGVEEGFQRTVELEPSPNNEGVSGESRNITIETLSLKPLVLSITGFLSDEECDYIAEKAGPSMRYSQVSLKDADKGKAASEWRTSQSAFLSAQDDPILTDIEYRTASLTRVPRSHQEYVQVLRYGESEKYDAHHDYFDPAAYQNDQGTMSLIQHGKKNRFATVFWYLTDVNEGGHTIFPRAGGLPPVYDHSDCSRGLKVQPRKGKVIIFYSLDPSGDLDPLSLHGACPVGEDNVKWAANKWLWNAPMGYVRD